MEDKKNLLIELCININKGDGPSAKTLFVRLKVTVNRKGKMNGAEFDGTRIIVQKGKKLEYTEDTKKLAKVNEFKELVKNAELEHKKNIYRFCRGYVNRYKCRRGPFAFGFKKYYRKF